jgi:hypothetical protein
MLGLERYQPLALRAEDRSRPDTAIGRAGQCREVKRGAGFGVRSRLRSGATFVDGEWRLGIFVKGGGAQC